MTTITVMLLFLIVTTAICVWTYLADKRTEKAKAQKILFKKEDDEALRDVLRAVRNEAAYQVSTHYLQIMLAGTELDPLLQRGIVKSDELYYELDEERRKELRKEVEEIQAQLKEGMAKLKEFQDSPKPEQEIQAK